MKHGDFDNDSKALRRRIALQEKLGSRDLNHWIFEQLEPGSGLKCLDLGCGTGKQSIALARIVGVDGQVTSLDISPESLSNLVNEAAIHNFDNRITTINGTLDDLDILIRDAKFERIVSSYAIYYAESPASVVNTIKKHLASDGIGFWCGPDSENNLELRKLLHSLDSGIADLGPTKAATFLQHTIEIARSLFSNVRISSFENSIHYQTYDDLFDYWSSHNSYRPELEKKFEVAASKHFAEHGSFINIKRAVGIRVQNT